MKIYVAAFMLLCGITSLANVQTLLINGFRDGRPTLDTIGITTSGRVTTIHSPDGRTQSVTMLP